MPGLDGMDSLAVARGILCAASERFSFGVGQVDIGVSVALIAALADEVARHRDERAALGLPPLEGTIRVHGTPEAIARTQAAHP